MPTPITYNVELLYNNPKALVTITFPQANNLLVVNSKPIIGLIETDFTTDVTSIFNDTDEGQGAFAGAAQGLNAAVRGGNQRVMKSLQQTFSQWGGHTKPVFTVPITIVKYRSTGSTHHDDVLYTVKTLMSAPAGNWNGAALYAPFGYGTNNGTLSTSGVSAYVDTISQLGNLILGTPVTNLANPIFLQNIAGTYCLSYGDWFYACGLILTHTSVIVSKESIKGTNEPLYARMTLTFTTAILPDATMIRSWFKDPTPDSGGRSGDLANSKNGSIVQQDNSSSAF